MEPTELDLLLDELETRVERLRALYDQYFMGIEKIPPHVVQKDVDRRLYALRREQIRNTARRFKLQTIIQRYNTFQQYWMRIMREIENGTYRRHVLRAERTVGVTTLLTAAERKRLGLPEPQLSPETGPDPTGAQPDPEQPDSLDRTVKEPSDRPLEQPQQVREQIERDLGLMLDDDLDDLDTNGLLGLGNELDDPLLSSMPPAAHKRRASGKPLARRSTRPNVGLTGGGTQPKPEQRNAPASTVDGTMSLEGSPHSSRQPPAATRKSLRPIRTGPAMGSAAIPGQGGLRLPASSAVAGRGLPPLPRPTAPRGAPPKIPSRPVIAIGDDDASGVKPSPAVGSSVSGHTNRSSGSDTLEARQKPALRPPPRQSEPSAQELPRAPRASELKQPPLPPATRPVDPIQRAPDPPSAATTTRQPSLRGMPDLRESVVPRRTNPPPPSAADRARVSADAEKSNVPPRPERSRLVGKLPVDALPTAPKTAQRNETLDRARVEQIAEKLRAARQSTHETAPVSVDALAKKLQTTAEELAKKHAGRRIDFDVIVKDGKAIVKPIVR